MKAGWIFICSCLILLSWSCNKAFFGKDEAGFSRVQNFEYLWKQCDERYAYFKYKNVDWDKIHQKYAALIHEQLSSELFFDLLRDMLNELKDGHVNLKSSFNVSKYNFSLQPNRTYDGLLIQKKYLPSNYYTTGPFIHDFIVNHPQVAYIRLSSFTGTISHFHLNFILNKYKNSKGLVFDIRQNGGGVIDDVYTILSHFISAKTTVWQTQIRNGAGHEDFSALTPSYLEPAADAEIYLKPVVILTDKGTFSSGSFLALGSKAIPQMQTMGEDTGGGLGLPNGGQLPNGWTYRFSITRALDMQKNNYENGVPVATKVFFDANNNPTQKDAILEKAISVIEN